jgi:hypothetical protein
MDKESRKYDNVIAKRFCSTLFYGVIINFVILLASEPEDGIQTLYPILLVVSLFGGYILSHVFSFFERKE